ncbi:MAG: hypothetical protein JXR48_19215 [Candidatus Delongbacteria bacterium]|nr:hypothetical protein [Candidatus Delongbacteria bacterium]MBN2837092.1 hypothetical protein [Candidatus Delongbacteria bacterium]
MVKQDVKLNPKHSRKQLKSFDDSKLYNNYQYRFYITNITSLKKIFIICTVEELIQKIELKKIHNFVSESSGLSNLFATEAALYFAVMT